MQESELNENDYEELLTYTIEQLSLINADYVIEQIKSMESLSVVEESPLKKEKKPVRDKYGQISFPGIYDDDKEYVSDEKTQGKDSDLGHYITRQITFREMFLETMKLLDTYLVSVPAMAERTKNLLEQPDSDLIQWKNEGSKRIDKEIRRDTISSIEGINSQDRVQIGEILNAIYTELGIVKDVEKE